MTIRHDALGPVDVPDGALWGAQTQRAVENFPVSCERIDPAVIRALARIKAAAATTPLPRVDADMADAIRRAALAVAAGEHADQFPVDVFQTGSGTSTNMNVNEVIAAIAERELDRPVDANDHVNAGQSSNDAVPTAIRLAVIELVTGGFLPAADALADALRVRADEHRETVKAGRTHLMDAAPIFLGDELAGWAGQLDHGRRALAATLDDLAAVPLGGTAVGTGLGAPPYWAAQVLAELSNLVGYPLTEPTNRFAAQAGQETLVAVSGALRLTAVALTKIANDLRLLSSGPNTGLGELVLPVLQPGSSIMPGKVNPVVCEAVLQVAARVIGNDATVTWAAASGTLELNTYLPVMGEALVESVRLLTAAMDLLRTRCIDHFAVDVVRLRYYAGASPALATAVAAVLGHERTSKLVADALASGEPLVDRLREELAAAGHPDDEIDALLDPARLARGSRPD